MKKILVVDDDAEIRQLIKLTLGAKYFVFEAESAVEASIKLEEVRPDMILLDIMMPGLNGLMWAKMIRRWYQFSNVIIVMVSALNQQDDVMDGLESGANGYISKPFSPAKLLEEIDRHFLELPI